jgi:hypothetical protein
MRIYGSTRISPYDIELSGKQNKQRQTIPGFDRISPGRTALTLPYGRMRSIWPGVSLGKASACRSGESIDRRIDSVTYLFLIQMADPASITICII